MGDSIYVIKPDTFFSNIAQDSIARNNINKKLEINTQQKLKEPSELYNAIEHWDTGNSLAKAEWKQWALGDFEGFKEYYKQYKTLLKNLDIDKLYGAKAKPNRVTSYGTKTDIGKDLFQSLLKVGFSEVLALAILANSYHETMGWSKMNLLNNGPARGLLQMEEAARLSYANFREANNLEENTDALALYIASLFLNGKSIPTTYYDNSGKGEAYTTALALEDWNSGDLDKTVKAFMYSYERPGTPMLEKRLGVALLLSNNKHLFYKEGGSIKRNDIRSTFFAKDGLPGGMLFMYLQPSSTNVQSLSNVLPVEYYDKNIIQSAKALGLTVEEYLKLIEKSNLPGAIYEDSGNDGVNYYRSRTAADPRAREAAAIERQRQDQALEQLKQEAGKAANLLLSLGMPSTYVGLATGAMDLSTGEGKNNTAGKVWGNTRLILDIVVPIAGLSIYKGARLIPRLSYEILPVTYSKLKNMRRSAQIALTLNNSIRRATKNGHIEVPKTYFSDPQKAYRRTVGPTEIEDVKTVGYFRDAHESTTVPEGMLRSHGVSGWTRGYPYWSFNKKYATFLSDPKKIHSFFEVDGTGKSFNVGATGNYSLDLVPFENIEIRSAEDAARGTATGAFGIKPVDKTILAQDANLFTINPLTGLYIYKGKVIPYKIQTYLVPTKVLSTIDPNGKIRIQLSTHTKTRPREFVLDPVGNNQYRFHQRIWDDVDKKVPGTLTLQEKDLLFQSVLDELPEGATILPTQSTPDYLATVGTVKGRKILNRMAEADGRFVLGEPLSFLYLEDGVVKEWSTPSITKYSPITRSSINYKFGGKLHKLIKK